MSQVRKAKISNDPSRARTAHSIPRRRRTRSALRCAATSAPFTMALSIDAIQLDQIEPGNGLAGIRISSARGRAAINAFGAIAEDIRATGLIIGYAERRGRDTVVLAQMIGDRLIDERGDDVTAQYLR